MMKLITSNVQYPKPVQREREGGEKGGLKVHKIDKIRKKFFSPLKSGARLANAYKNI
jgi:hypothetical protein